MPSASAHLRQPQGAPDIWKAQYRLQRDLPTGSAGGGKRCATAPFQCLNALEFLGWNFRHTNSLFAYCIVHCVAGEKWLHVQGPRTRWQYPGNTWQMSSFPSRQGFPPRSIFWHPRPKERHVGDICPQSEFTTHMAFNAAHSQVAPVIFHGLLNCSPHLKSGYFSLLHL